jgi:hypothetical protein
MEFEITPQPTEEERAAIEAAMGEEIQDGRPSPWAGRPLSRRDLPHSEGEPEP